MFLPKFIIYYYIGCVLIGVYWTLWVAIPLAIIGLLLYFILWAESQSLDKRFPNDKHYEWPSAGAFEVEVSKENYEGFFTGSRWIRPDVPRKAVLWPMKEGVVVIVQVDGQTVGELNYNDATAFRRRLGSKGLTGFKTECKLIRRDHQRKSTKWFKEYSLLLDIKPFRTKKNTKSSREDATVI